MYKRFVQFIKDLQFKLVMYVKSVMKTMVIEIIERYQERDKPGSLELINIGVKMKENRLRWFGHAE